MNSLGKDVGGLILPRVSLARGLTAASNTNIAGNIIDITSFSQGRANSVAAIVGAQANLDTADTFTVSGVRLQSSDSATFASNVVDRVTDSGIVLTGAADNTDYAGQVMLKLDLATLPATHKYLRLVANTAISDTTNTAYAAISGTFVFGGLAMLP